MEPFLYMCVVVLMLTDSVRASEKYFCGFQKNSTQLDIEEIVEDCGTCRESLCRKSSSPQGGMEEERVCLWNDYSGSCVAATKVSCGRGSEAPDCGQCGPSVEQCGGECYWLAEVSLCLHSEVFSAPPYVIITSEGPALQRHPAIWGLYTLTDTDWQSKSRLGWTRETADNKTFHYFADISPDTDGMEYISNKKVFSVKNAIITRNNTAKSSWEFVIDQENDERRLMDPTIHAMWVYVKEDKDCEWGQWTEWSWSSSCGPGLRLRWREVETEARGSGARCEGSSVEQEEWEGPPCYLGYHLTELTLFLLPYLLLTLATTTIIILLCCRDRLFGGKSDKESKETNSNNNNV